jgi:hypothetical protein
VFLKMSTKKFFRLEPGAGTDPLAIIGSPTLTSPDGLLAKLRRRDGILIATWEPHTEQGRVHALGFVQEIDKGRSAVVDWRPANFTLQPSGQGAVQWRKRPFFEFAEKVAARYGLIDYFDDAFSTSNVGARDREGSVEGPPAAFATATVPESLVAHLPTDATGFPESAGPQCNRVAPNGDIFATPARGLFMGNRTSPPRWLVCGLHFERNLKEPRKYTKLFFLDEAVALAAGHRPCNTCRRDRYEAYLSAVRAEASVAGATELDALLNAARRTPGLRAPIASLPDGAFIALGGDDYRLKWRGGLHRWSPAGYVDAVTAIDLVVDGAPVLTPEPSLAALRNGYLPEVHPTTN